MLTEVAGVDLDFHPIRVVKNQLHYAVVGERALDKGRVDLLKTLDHLCQTGGVEGHMSQLIYDTVGDLARVLRVPRAARQWPPTRNTAER